MRDSLMDTQPVNWGVLDALVLDYAEAELLLDRPGDVLSPPLSNTSPRHTIELIRVLIEAGCITEALHLMQEHAPVVLEDQHLLFRLHKQKFIELLRSGGADAVAQAIECSRSHLGPCALNAYPEAYEEFKRVLLALMYDKDDCTSPVAEEWSEVRRAELAATIASTLKAQSQAYDPLFSLTLRYLISMHNGYCLRQGVASPITDVAVTVLSKERDPPAMPQECLMEAPKFNESDVQGLAHAVELPRQGAVDSLRYASGDLLTAFKNELSRLRVNVGTIDELVREYCVYRGLIEGGPPYPVNGKGSSNDPVAAQLTDVLATGIVNSLKAIGTRGPSLNSSLAPAQAAEQEPGVSKCAGLEVVHECFTEANEIGIKADTENSARVAGSSEVEQSDSTTSDVCMEDLANGCVAEVVRKSISEGVDNVGVTESIRNCGGCSTSGSSHASINGMRSEGQLNGVGKGNTSLSSMARRRWKGRRQTARARDFVQGLWGPNLESSKCISREDLSPANVNEAEETAMVIDAQTVANNEPEELVFEKYERALEIRQMASEGKTEEVIDEVHRLNPSFFEQNPQLLFQLKQVEFLKLVEAGNYSRALGIARADLGPLAAKFPDLLRSLKETLLALARPRGDLAFKPTPPPVLAAALQVALGASLGIAEPQLTKIMRATLYTHTLWFKLQMCADPFADLLKLTALKEGEPATMSTVTSVEDVNIVAGSTSCLSSTDTSGIQPSDLPREGPLFDEASILTLMEFLALSRGDAIQLLVQHDGSVESVFTHLMS